MLSIDQTRIQSHYSVRSELQSLSKEEIHGDIQITKKKRHTANWIIYVASYIFSGGLLKKILSKKIVPCKFREASKSHGECQTCGEYPKIFWNSILNATCIRFFFILLQNLSCKVERKAFPFSQYILYMSYQYIYILINMHTHKI